MTALRDLAVFLAGLAALAAVAHCPPAHGATAVPQVAVMYRLAIEREAVRNFGLAAPAARLAAQVHQESGWDPRAASPYAQGLAQFTPATARWLPTVCPAVGPPDPWDPHWSLRAQACYMAWLHGRVQPLAAVDMEECSHWAFTLRAYNGGERMLARERQAALRAQADADDWQAVEPYRVRAPWAHRENTAYPRRILLRLEPAYLAAGWAGQAVCP